MKILTLLLLIISGYAYGQDADTTYWRRSFRGSVSFNQASFTENWKGGGINSIGFNSMANFRANYLKDKNSWDNEIDLLYGSINNEGTGYRKNNDRIYMDTKYGRKISEKWNLFGSLNLLTQFANGFRFVRDSLDREVPEKISQFMAPGFITTAWGFEYVPQPYFRMRLAPFAPRLTVVMDKEIYQNVETNFGVPIGQTTRWEWLAFQFMADFDKNLTENLNLKFRYVMFANYETFEFDKIDHRLDAIISAKVAKYFEVQLNAIVLYDFDQDSKIQLSQALGIGFVYSKSNFKE